MKKVIKNILIFILLIAIIIGIVFFINSKIKSNSIKNEPDNDILDYSFEDESIPGGHYDIKINFTKKSLYVKEVRYDSTLEGKTQTLENDIELSDEEVKIIKQILKKENYNKEYLSIALSRVVLGDEIFSTSDFSKDYDLNGDGIVTNREFGVSYLNVLLMDN